MRPDDEKTEDRDYDTEAPENAGRATMDDTLDKIMDLFGMEKQSRYRDRLKAILEDHDDEMCKIWCGEY